MYSYGSPHMAAQKQDNQLERTFSSYVRIQDVVLKTYLGRWTIGRSGERGSWISVLPARYDDDDDDIYIYITYNIYYIYIYIYIREPSYHKMLECKFDFQMLCCVPFRTISLSKSVKPPIFSCYGLNSTITVLQLGLLYY